MTEIHINDEVTIYNDMPRGWIEGKGQPRWHLKVYDMWRNMWNRCKNSNNKYYEYYKDCKIYDDFDLLSNYVNFVMSEPLFDEFIKTCDKVKWSIDKDKKYLNNINYYPEYMTLTTGSENSKEMISRVGNITPVIAIDENNKVLLFKSMYDAEDKGFKHSAISKCVNKKLKAYKGYKWHKVNYKYTLKLRKVQFLNFSRLYK